MPSDYAVSIPCLTECSAPFAAQSSSVISAVVLLVAGVFNLYQEFTSPEDDYKFMAMYQLLLGILVIVVEFRDRLPCFDEGKPLNTYLVECECLGEHGEKIALKKGVGLKSLNALARALEPERVCAGSTKAVLYIALGLGCIWYSDWIALMNKFISDVAAIGLIAGGFLYGVAFYKYARHDDGKIPYVYQPVPQQGVVAVAQDWDNVGQP